MLSWFRIHAARIAATAIIALSSVGLSAVSPHVDDCHDAGCMAMVVDHDAAAHVFSAPPAPGAAPLHCLVCHLVRSFRLRAEAPRGVHASGRRVVQPFTSSSSHLRCLRLRRSFRPGLRLRSGSKRNHRLLRFPDPMS